MQLHSHIHRHTHYRSLLHARLRVAVQGAARADQRGPDASQPPAPDGAVATVAPQERGLEMQPEEKVTHARARARARARTCRHPRAHSRTRAQTHG